MSRQPRFDPAGIAQPVVQRGGEGNGGNTRKLSPGKARALCA